MLKYLDHPPTSSAVVHRHTHTVLCIFESRAKWLYEVRTSYTNTHKTLNTHTSRLPWQPEDARKKLGRCLPDHACSNAENSSPIYQERAGIWVNTKMQEAKKILTFLSNRSMGYDVTVFILLKTQPTSRYFYASLSWDRKGCGLDIHWSDFKEKSSHLWYYSIQLKVGSHRSNTKYRSNTKLRKFEQNPIKAVNFWSCNRMNRSNRNGQSCTVSCEVIFHLALYCKMVNFPLFKRQWVF